MGLELGGKVYKGNRIDERKPDREVLHRMGNQEWYKERIIDPCIRMYETILWERKVSEEELSAQINKEREWLEKEEIFAIPRISIIITTRCTLQCVNCSQMIPCYTEPYDIDLEDIICSMARILKLVDKCYAVDVLGGEPFLVKEIDRLLEWLKSQEKILQVSFTTNGTVLPDDKTLKALCDNKVLVRVSDYGLLKQQSNFLSEMERQKIHVIFESGMKWVDAGDGSARSRSIEELRKIYRNCNSGKACKTLLKGKLYHCSRCANLYDLNKASANVERDVLEIKETDEHNMRENMKKFFLLDYSGACDNCDLALKQKKYIAAGVQKNQKVKNSEFTIVSRRDFEIKDKMLMDCREEIQRSQKAIDDLKKMNSELRAWSEDLQKEINRLSGSQ